MKIIRLKSNKWNYDFIATRKLNSITGKLLSVTAESYRFMGTIKNMMLKSWYSKKENWDITFNTLHKEYTWRVFSIYSIDVTNDYLYTKFETTEEYQTFLDMIKNRSDIKMLKAKPTTDDKILTLSTCLNGDRRLVVHAVLVTEE